MFPTDAPSIPRRSPADRPWRRGLIAVGLAVGIHAIVIAAAWPFVREWVNAGGYANPALTGPARSGPVTRGDVERAMAESPIITGLIASPSAAELVMNGEEFGGGWSANPPTSLEHTPLPFAPQPWLAFSPPVASLSFELPAVKPSDAMR